MPTARYGASLDCGGVSINQNIQRTADNAQSYEVSLPAGKAGTLTTRTDNNTGTATLGSGHGITDGTIVDIHWSGGVQYHVTVGTVSGTSVPFDLGVGDNLPIATTAIVMTPQVIVNTTLDGDRASVVGICLESSETTGNGHVDFQDVDNDSIEEVDLVANVPQIHDITGGATNVFTGDPITHCHATNGSSTAAATLKVLLLADSTP